MKIKYEPILLVLVCLCLVLTFYQSYQTYKEDYAKKIVKRVEKKEEKKEEKKVENPPPVKAQPQGKKKIESPKKKRAVRKSPGRGGNVSDNDD